ncbi:MAG: ribonuclease P protein component, partial [Verrucomicrobia bacterium]|nr:ribonuclease P protein component [Verrucomicrobiota bacterium]
MATGISTSLRFGRAQRLAVSADFDRLKARGRRLTEGCLVANWMDLPAGATPRLGVVTSRRLGNAVVRARARR